MVQAASGPVPSAAGEDLALRDRAAAVLQGNDAGGWTRAAPRLYPHQWSWDSAFIAIGWAHLDTGRALTELEGLFAAQWPTGMVPHIVFRAGPDHPYFPGPEWWDCAIAAPSLPAKTTGICQPPVHALAVRRIWELTPPDARPEIRARIQTLYPRLVAWHRYLATQRDPEASGLVTTYHPWEGTDNSPRWDRALARIQAPDPGPYTRLDTSELGDPSQRPADWDYDRYLHLVGLLRKYRYDDALIYRHYPFLIKDVFFSAVLVAANAALLDLADVAGASDGDREQLAGWLDRGRAGLAARFDAGSGLCVDYDVRAEQDIRLRTFATFAPLFARAADAGQRDAQLRLLDSGDFCGDPRLRWRLLPSTSPAEPAFESRTYWRGPVWPVISWLLTEALTALGAADRAVEMRRDSLAQIAGDGDFAEYYEPFTGKPLGSQRQSWTAAVTLDWLAASRLPVLPCGLPGFGHIGRAAERRRDQQAHRERVRGRCGGRLGLEFGDCEAAHFGRAPVPLPGGTDPLLPDQLPVARRALVAVSDDGRFQPVPTRVAVSTTLNSVSVVTAI